MMQFFNFIKKNFNYSNEKKIQNNNHITLNIYIIKESGIQIFKND